MELISAEYRALQVRLHEDPEYGIASVYFAPLVCQAFQQTGSKELLDYGAGKGRLADEMRKILGRSFGVRFYDPAIPKWARSPKPCEFVACVDVLEHIEPVFLDSVLDDLRRVTARIGFFTVHTGPAIKILSDGRNAHLIQRPYDWWLPKLIERFDLVQFVRDAHGFWVGVEKKL